MLECDLELGDCPWTRLAEGPVSGTLLWNGPEGAPVSVRIRGAHSRRFPRKSLQVDAVDCRLPDPPPAEHTVRRLHLNADYIDPTRMRSALCFRLFADAGVPAPLCRHTRLTVSGEPLGIYMLLESVDRDFCRRRGWKPGPIYYALNRNANFSLVSPTTRSLKQPLETGYKAVARADFTPLRRMLMDLNLAPDRTFAAVADRCIDVEGYLRWLLVAVFVGNRDGFVHNYALYRDPDSGLFRIIPWDYDATWGIDVHGRPARLDRVPIGGWNRLSQRLLASPSIRRRYRRLVVEMLNGPLSPESVLPLIDNLRSRLAPWIDKDVQTLAEGGDFSTGVQGLRRWAVERRTLLLQELERL